MAMKRLRLLLNGQRRRRLARRKAGRILMPLVLTSKIPDRRCRVLEGHEEARLEGRLDFKTPRRGREGRHRERWVPATEREKRKRKEMSSRAGARAAFFSSLFAEKKKKGKGRRKAL